MVLNTFVCENCGEDLAMNLELLARAMRVDYENEDLPKEVVMDGYCGECHHPFRLDGEMFSHYVLTKAQENVINDEANNYAILSFDVTDEESDEFNRLVDEGRFDELSDFLDALLDRTLEPEE